MTISLPLYLWNKKTDTEALLDSGAMDNFIDLQTVKTCTLGTRKLKQPHLINNVDGTPNQAGSITDYCLLNIRQGDKTVTQAFYITNLGRDRLILGDPWFKEFNPRINWSKRLLEGASLQLETLSFTRSREVRLHADEVQYPPQLPNYSGTRLPSYHQSFEPIEGIPTEYQKHMVVFSEKASQ